MADVQVEHGHTRIANELLEALIRAPITPGQFRVMFAILRLTFGWNRKADRIASSQLSELTGLRASSVRRILAQLEDRNLILRTVSGPNRAPTIGVQKDYEMWKLAPQQERLSTTRSRSPRRAALAPLEERKLALSEEHTKERKTVLKKEGLGADAPNSLEPVSSVIGAQKNPDRFLNLLGKRPGSPEAKRVWFEENLPRMVLEVAALGLKTEHQRNAKLGSMVIGWYNWHLKNPNGKGVVESFEERRVRKLKEFASQ